ncbi:MAG: hypothetical protein A2017_21135 [Lentisphaerae bacterium GWF2_44_16]|nr:MAG: hypothetical protein A2017_21135 [Lentisphaerae bacterium GWF2_44_16]
MRRFQLMEIHEQAWCPELLRNGVTDFLEFAAEMGEYFQSAAPLLSETLVKIKSSSITDLCSGGGGPWKKLYPLISASLEKAPSLVLSDKYPNAEAFQKIRLEFPDSVNFISSSVDAAEVPETAKGFRTLFGAFHHFTPPYAEAVMRNAVENGEGIGIFEFTERSLIYFLILFPAVFSVFIFTPFIRPFSFFRLLLTYIIPLIPLIIFIDGAVSCLRSYSSNEMMEIAGKADPGGTYKWLSGRMKMKGPPLHINYLIGYRKDAVKS